MNTGSCEHIRLVEPKESISYQCEECVKTGDSWVHLRTCQDCGVTLCCDSSPNQHASKHAQQHGHHVVKSAEPGENWYYCYAHNTLKEVDLKDSHQNTKFYRSIIHSAPTPIGAIDIIKNEIIYSSGLAEDLLGYSNDEFITFSKNDFIDIVHPEDRDQLRQLKYCVRNAADDSVISSIIRFRSKDRKYLHFHLFETVYERDFDGKPTKYTFVVEDITETAKLRDELAEKVEVIKKISWKNSHELRVPVAKILAVGELLQSKHISTQYVDDIFHAMFDAVTKLDEVIHEINSEIKY